MRITSYTVELDGKLSVLVKDKAVNYHDTSLNEPSSIAQMMRYVFSLHNKAEEYIYILGMNTKCHLIGVFMLSKGSVDASIIVPRDIFVRLFLCGASNFVMVHNHPSGYIVELEIPEDALRCSACSRKCRCSKAKVVAITTVDGFDAGITSIESGYDRNFIYTVGNVVSVDNFDPDRWHECAPGIPYYHALSASY